MHLRHASWALCAPDLVISKTGLTKKMLASSLVDPRLSCSADNIIRDLPSLVNPQVAREALRDIR
jgi:hypothetical protein